MKNKNSYKEHFDQSKKSDKEITEALDRIISRARRENNALSKVLRKINKQDATRN